MQQCFVANTIISEFVGDHLIFASVVQCDEINAIMKNQRIRFCFEISFRGNSSPHFNSHLKFKKIAGGAVYQNDQEAWCQSK